MRIAPLVFAIVLTARAQTNQETSASVSNSPATRIEPAGQRRENIRAECIRGRRCICGMILKLLPDGFIVDSGYTSLLRPPPKTSWLVPGNVPATRPANLMEATQPGAVCVGPVYLMDIPKLRGAVVGPKQYDYIILLGYPAGHFTYTSVGSVRKTVRRFSASLLKAVDLNDEAAGKPGAVSPSR